MHSRTHVDSRSRVRAWRPDVPGIAEAFHATLWDYRYPQHCHDTWTLLSVDDGAVFYSLDRHGRHASPASVDVLPPGVVHDGSPVGRGFRKRVLYVDDSWLPADLAGHAVDRSSLADPALRRRIGAVHDALDAGDELRAETELTAATERIVAHLRRQACVTETPERRPEPATARRLRAMLDERRFERLTLAEAAAALGRNRTHLVRSFTFAYGISPHAYVTGKRIDAARRMLLAGDAPAEVAATVGFHDQAHLTRHFVRHTATTPARFASGAP